MDFGLLIALAFAVLVGILTLLSARWVGHLMYEVNAEIRDSLAPSPRSRWWKFVTGYLALDWGESWFIWLVRIIGICFIGGPVVVLAIVLFS